MLNELINIDAINDFLSEKGWTSYRLSKELGLDYSYVFRVLKKEVNGGNKFLTRLIEFCNRSKISLNEFIFLGSKLSKDNDVEYSTEIA